MSSIRGLEAIKYEKASNLMLVLDQKLLPVKHEYIDVEDMDNGYKVIKNMNVSKTFVRSV